MKFTNGLGSVVQQTQDVKSMFLTLVHRLRRWTKVKPALMQRLVPAGWLQGRTPSNIALQNLATYALTKSWKVLSLCIWHPAVGQYQWGGLQWIARKVRHWADGCLETQVKKGGPPGRPAALHVSPQINPLRADPSVIHIIYSIMDSFRAINTLYKNK